MQQSRPNIWSRVFTVSMGNIMLTATHRPIAPASSWCRALQTLSEIPTVTWFSFVIPDWKNPSFGLLGATTVAKPLANLAGLHSSLNGLCFLMEESMPVPDADACNCTGGGSTGCAYGIESRNNATARAACRPQSILASALNPGVAKRRFHAPLVACLGWPATCRRSRCKASYVCALWLPWHTCSRTAPKFASPRCSALIPSLLSSTRHRELGARTMTSLRFFLVATHTSVNSLPNLKCLGRHIEISTNSRRQEARQIRQPDGR